MKYAAKFLSLLLTLALCFGLAACGQTQSASTGPENSGEAKSSTPISEEITISLEDDTVLVNGQDAKESDSVSLSNDIIYYEQRTTYPSGNPYGEGTAEEQHSAQDAAAHTVVNIQEPGTYRISGKASAAQIRVDLGKDAETDPSAVVNLILDNADLTCSVAPAILFLNVYECDNGWSEEAAGPEVDTSAAGANLILAEGSQNRVKGSHVARIFEDNEDEEKLWKQDGAVYSYMSMNVKGEGDGSGTLEIEADNEGLDTELHLTIDSGNLQIRSQNDGINTNEDGISVTTINGGDLHITAGLGAEGDGIDSNGWLVINGGRVFASANPASDAGMDSDMGSYINGGTVLALGSTMDWAESDSDQVTLNLQFASQQTADTALALTREDGSLVFGYDPASDNRLGENARTYMGAILSAPDLELEETYTLYTGGSFDKPSSATGFYAAGAAYTAGTQMSYTGTDVRGHGGGRPGGFTPGEMPEGMERPERPEGMEPGQMPEGIEPPEGMEPGRIPERPERPEGMEPGQMPEGMEPPEDAPNPPAGASQTRFYMQDKVNNFSGLQPAAEITEESAL